MAKKDLFDLVMSNEWQEVYKQYEDRNTQKQKILRSEDTVLHIAVLKGKTEAVKKLVSLINSTDEESVLSTKNEKGNTPLHLAAMMGDEQMCECLAKGRPNLIEYQNKERENPLFLAALFNKKRAFICLHNIYTETRDAFPLFRKGTDGDTILHVAINGEFFSFAYEMIKIYPELANKRNVQGLSPLHALANKPHAFQSGNHPGFFDWLIYQCIIVTERNRESTDNRDSGFKTNSVYPQNYETLMSILRWIGDQLEVLNPKTDQKGNTDEENPHQNRTGGQAIPISPAPGTPDESQSTTIKNLKKWNIEKAKGIGPSSQKKKRLYPPNYDTIVHVLKSTIRLLLIILGLGIWRIKKIKEKKEGHYWANLIMNEIIGTDTNAAGYKYEYDGTEPLAAQSGEYDRAAYGVSTTSPPSDTEQAEEPIGVEKNSSQPPSDKADTKKSSQGESAFLEALKVAVPEIVKGIWEKCHPTSDTQKSSKGETAFLVASKMGVTEIVKGILEKCPVAIHDVNSDGKNVVLLAVEHRQTHVYNLLLREENILRGRVFHHVDDEGNSALHLAATFGDHRPWLIPGDALQMQWEMKWYEFVKRSVPSHFFVRKNKNGETAKQLLTKTHEKLMEKGGEWMTKTSESCSVVAALIATVAFATSATVPGGVNEAGHPVLKEKALFDVFAISSLIALCFSVTSMVFFLTILTSRFQEKDFAMDLPTKLLIGLSTLFMSIAAILVSFCAGHFFLLKDNLKYAAYPIYVATCLPVSFFGLTHLPLYFDLIRCIFQRDPQPSYKR